MRVITNYNYNGTDTFNTVYANQDMQSILVLEANGTDKIFADLGYTTSPGESTGTTIISVKWNDWRGFALSLPLHWTKSTDTFKYGVISASNTITWHEVATTDDLVAEVNALTTKINGKANSSHTHDDRYFTESEINSKLNTINNKSLCHQGPNSWTEISTPVTGGVGNYVQVSEFTVGEDDAGRYGFIEYGIEIDIGSSNSQVSVCFCINDSVYSCDTTYVMANDSARVTGSAMCWFSSNNTYQIKVGSTRTATVTHTLHRVYTFRPNLAVTNP